MASSRGHKKYGAMTDCQFQYLLETMMAELNQSNQHPILKEPQGKLALNK